MSRLFNVRSHFKVLFAVAITAFFFGIGAHAKDLTLAWDPNPEPDVVGYKAYFSKQSGVFSTAVSLVTNPSVRIQNLDPNSTYYFAVTAVNSAGLESLPSDEISYTTPQIPSPIASISNPVDGTVAAAPASVTITAGVDGVAGIVRRVEFYIAGELKGIDATPPFQLNVNNLGEGTYALVVRSINDKGATTLSPITTLTILSPTATATVSVINGGPGLHVVGLPGETLRVEKSGDLENWIPVMTVNNTIGTVKTTDPSGTGNNAFYRALPQ